MKTAPIYYASDYSQFEKKAIEMGSDAASFMSQVATKASSVIDQIAKRHHKHVIKVLFGKGNNGGDGLLIATLMHAMGYQVKAYTPWDVFHENLSELTSHQLKVYKNLSLPLFTNIVASDLKIEDEDLMVDALFGSGFLSTKTLNDHIVDCIETLNQHHGLVVAIDVPSGLSGDTGIGETVVRSRYTLAVGSVKMGLLHRDGPSSCGVIDCIDFDLPLECVDQKRCLGQFLLKPSNEFFFHFDDAAHKYEKGQLVIAAGSQQMPGAGYMTANSAYRSGCGMVRLFTRGESHTSIPELIVANLESATEEFFMEVKRSKAVVAGPGLLKDDVTKSLIKRMLAEVTVPLVIDADALYCIDKEDVKKRLQPLVLTPHAKECADLIGVDQINYSDLSLFSNFAKEHHCFLVLKGPISFIFSDSHPPLAFGLPNAGLATAGAGDILSGLVGSVLTKIQDPYEAVAFALFVHQHAGLLAKETKTAYAMHASDVIEALPAILKRMDHEL